MLRLHARTLAVALVVAAGSTGLAGTAASAAPAPAAPVCNLTATPDTPSRTEDRGCLQISSKLSAAPAVGETATLDVTVRAAKDLTGVDIDAELPPTLQWVQAPQGLTAGTRTSRAPHTRGTLHTAHVRRSVAAQQVLRYRGTVKAVAAGPAEIAVRAGSASQPQNRVADAVHLTIGATASEFGIKANTAAAAVPAAAPVTTTKAAVAAGQACVTGRWTWTDKDGISRPGAAWKVDAYDVDGSTDQLLTSGTVAADGTYLLCFGNTDQDGTGQDVKVRFTSDAGNWRVVTFSDVAYTYTSAVVSNVATLSTTTVDLTPGNAMQMRAASAFEAVRKAWEWKPGACWDAEGACSAVVVKWTPDSTDGTYYCGQACGIHLAWQDPDSATTTIHETGHSVMDDVYDYNYPPTNCSSPHYITAGADPGCAWSEGFAEWFPSVVLDDPYFRWPDGGSLDLENPTLGLGERGRRRGPGGRRADRPDRREQRGRRPGHRGPRPDLGHLPEPPAEQLRRVLGRPQGGRLRRRPGRPGDHRLEHDLLLQQHHPGLHRGLLAGERLLRWLDRGREGDRRQPDRPAVEGHHDAAVRRQRVERLERGPQRQHRCRDGDQRQLERRPGRGGLHRVRLPGQRLQ